MFPPNASAALARRTTRDLLIATMALALFAAVTPSRGDDEGKDKDDRPPVKEKKNLLDLKNTLDNLSLVRDVNRLSKPMEHAALWQELTDPRLYEKQPLRYAQALLFHGQYEDAQAAFEDLLKTDLPPTQKNRALLGRLAAIAAQQTKPASDFETALATIPPALQDHPLVTTLRAQALVRAGKLPDAQALLATYVAAHPIPKPPAFDAPLMTLYNLYGHLLEQTANYPAAAATYEKLTPLAEETLPEDTADAAEIQTQLAIALWRDGLLTMQAAVKQQDILRRLDHVTKDIDRTYWPAELAIGQLLLANHNTKDGGAAIEQALSLNPNLPEANFTGIDFAISGYDFEAAQSQLEAVKNMTDSPEVSAFTGRLILKQRLPDQAIAPLVDSVTRDPYNPRARGWLAGAYYLTNQPEKADAQLDALHTPDGAANPIALYEAAEVLRDARQYPKAEDLYIHAAKSAAWWSEPYAALAQLYLEVGNLDLAKKAYDESFKIDPTNQRAYNQLTLLDYLAKFKSIQTTHFLIRYSDDQDAILAQLISDWMENHVYPEVCAYFNYYIPTRTIIELYPSHEQFGVRTTGLPWIGTVGACTGNVIAMDVPRGDAKTQMGAFDWARVLRHEFTHAVTLGMTQNRIPHWLTEACACAQEEAPRDWENAELLCQNYRAGTLFKYADLNWGFIRPKRSIDRQLAYMQSQWIYEYLVETYGQPQMLVFLDAFKRGLTEKEAMQQTYKMSTDQFDVAFHTWAGAQLKSWDLPADPLPKADDARKAVADNPKDAAAKVTLATVLLAGGGRNAAQAEQLLRDALAIDPKFPRAREILGVILQAEKKNDEARTILTALVTESPNHPVALRTLGLMAMARKDYPDAETWFLKLQEVRPLEDTSYENLAGIYLLRKDPQRAIAQLLELQVHEQHDERIPRKLADLYRAQGDLTQAATFAFKAIRINPYNPINHQTLAEIDMQKGEPLAAIPYWKYATQLAPDVPLYWTSLAEAQSDTGDAKAAAASAQKAVDLDPNSPAKKYLQP